MILVTRLVMTVTAFGDVSVDVFKVRLNTSFESQRLIAVWLSRNP